ncbi:MAG: hypothetical protein PHS41_02440 [Victivallaceae bacterium]|nr:hypothetical protein [Victivallaceae bacterium]
MKVILNEDFENFFLAHPPEEMSEAGLLRQMATYAAADTIIFCGNGMRANFASKAFEPVWKNVEFRDGAVFYRGRKLDDRQLQSATYIANAKRLSEEIPDALAVRVREGRRRGIKVFSGMRMNDIHFSSDPFFPWNDPVNYAHEENLTSPWLEAWNGRTFNYAVPENYRRHLALAAEYLSHDIDGLELDWMRTPPHLQPGFEEANSGVLNNFMQEVRAFADAAQQKFGHKIELFVRVNAAPEDAIASGLDVPHWSEEGWIDRVTVTTYWGCSDHAMPIALWRRLLRDAVPVTAGLEIICRSSDAMSCSLHNTPEILRGFAANYSARGSDGLYLFNHMDGPPCNLHPTEALPSMLAELANDDGAWKTRRHVLGYRDFLSYPAGAAKPAILPFAPRGWQRSLRIPVGKVEAGTRATVALHFDRAHALSLRINGHPAVARKQGEFPFELPSDVSCVELFDVPEGALHSGDNILDFIGDNATGAAVTWCEMIIEPKKL